MSTEAIVYVLTAVAAVVVVLTRVRLGRGGGGRLHVGEGMLQLHTGAGGLAVVTWLVFLITPEDNPLGTSTFGIVALGLWWVTALAGLLVLLRWRRPRGRHASLGSADSWSQGPGLSILAHVAMVVCVCVFTWAYLNSVV